MSNHKCCLVKDEDYGWICEEDDCNKVYKVINKDDQCDDDLHVCRLWKESDGTWQCEDDRCDVVLRFNVKNRSR